MGYLERNIVDFFVCLFPFLFFFYPEVWGWSLWMKRTKFLRWFCQLGYQLTKWLWAFWDQKIWVMSRTSYSVMLLSLVWRFPIEPSYTDNVFLWMLLTYISPLHQPFSTELLMAFLQFSWDKVWTTGELFSLLYSW